MDLKKYTEFVEACTSAESEYTSTMINRLIEIEDRGVNASLLVTGAIGLSSESGEFAEIVKKTIFQGKDLDIFHLKRELGDIIWYWVNACRSLNLDPNEVIKENIEKLKARYPGGEFNSDLSENRADNDL